LTALAKKVLDPSETPETSLVAALLSSYKQDGSNAGTNKARRGRGGTTGNTNNGNGSNNKDNETMYTAQLEKIAYTVFKNTVTTCLGSITLHPTRSVGGSPTIRPADIDLEAVRRRVDGTHYRHCQGNANHADGSHSALCGSQWSRARGEQE
jgi:hypothetical protein